jgi:ABC-type sugar transport system ATPase subunit
MSAVSPAPGSIGVVGIEKAFGGVAALRGVDLQIRDGHAMGLVGENGAGKSTLINVLTGALAPDRGEVAIDGHRVTWKNPHDALRRGIGTVHQQNWLVPELTVVENLELGQETMRTPLRLLSRRIRDDSLEALDLVGLGSRRRDLVRDLTLAERQLVAVSRACARGTRLIIFDEPTASLSPSETNRLFAVIDRLRSLGRSILYVTHRLEELTKVVEEIVIMRAGEVVAIESSGLAENRLVDLIAGKGAVEQDQQTVATRRSQTAGRRHGDAVLVGDGLADAGGSFRDVSFELHAGEVLGVVGLPDSGAGEFVRALAGARRFTAGTLRLGDTIVRARQPRDALKQGIAYLPGDRKRNGVIPNANVCDTLTLAALGRVSTWGLVRPRQQRQLARELASQCAVRGASLQMPITALSGGNQQKALFGRTLATRPQVIVCEDPTAGVDPAGRESLYELLSAACGGGDGIVLCSSDLREVCAISDRVLVLWRGECVAELARDQLSVEALMAAQFKQSHTEAPS